MPSTYSNLKVQLMATGENTGTWGNVTNDNLGVALEQAIVETATVTFASANVTLTLTNTNARQDARALRLNLTGTTGGARDLIVPAIQKPYLVNNGTADIITVKVSGQTGIAVPAGKSMLLYNNGTDVGLAFNRVVADLIGNGSGITAMNASEITTGSLANARTTASSSNGASTIVARDASGNFSANVITANGSSITGLNASNISAGTLGVANGGTGATTLNSEAVVIGNSTGAVKFVAPGTSGNVLTSNGTAWASQAIAAGGDYVMQAYTSPATWTKPNGLKAVKVTVVGGGGGGGKGQPGLYFGATGGGGGTAIEYIDAPAIPGPVTVTVGGGGTGGPPGGPQGGGSGGTSSFGPFLSATGGGGGAGAASGGEPAGAGGAGSGGTINFTGGAGFTGGPGPESPHILNSNRAGQCGSLFTSPGLSSPLPSSSPGAGTTGLNYGGGGGAGGNDNVGGAGAGGLVIVEEFY